MRVELCKRNGKVQQIDLPRVDKKGNIILDTLCKYDMWPYCTMDRYKCMCGKGMLCIDDETNDFKNVAIWFDCPECKKKYVIERGKGIRLFEI